MVIQNRLKIKIQMFENKGNDIRWYHDDDDTIAHIYGWISLSNYSDLIFSWHVIISVDLQKIW